MTTQAQVSLSNTSTKLEDNQATTTTLSSDGNSNRIWTLAALMCSLVIGISFWTAVAVYFWASYS